MSFISAYRVVNETFFHLISILYKLNTMQYRIKAFGFFGVIYTFKSRGTEMSKGITLGYENIKR